MTTEPLLVSLLAASSTTSRVTTRTTMSIAVVLAVAVVAVRVAVWRVSSPRSPLEERATTFSFPSVSSY